MGQSRLCPRPGDARRWKYKTQLAFKPLSSAKPVPEHGMWSKGNSVCASHCPLEPFAFGHAAPLCGILAWGRVSVWRPNHWTTGNPRQLNFSEKEAIPCFSPRMKAPLTPHLFWPGSGMALLCHKAQDRCRGLKQLVIDMT